MSSDPLLSVRGLVSGYGSTRVLQGVDLDVPKGSVVTLIGRNGVGKTTTLRSILGSVTPSAGTISFGETDITALSPEKTAREGIALVPEERRVFPGLTVTENVEIGRIGGRKDIDKPTVDEIIDEFENLSRHRTSKGAALSGGEQQMLAIARALVSAPDLLMLDEPTEGLAPSIVKQVQRKIKELNDEGVTILLVEQNVQVALDAADYVYILDKGQVVHEGPADEVAASDEILDRYLGVSVAD
ncbi:ABC transporter ATP-binding protein (plasmid) [Haloferax mediterranei ATCC 33500]|uniref:ABC transporter ATP-binding protein n=1 Tax=Haloferax mediterranei (strain ATCC 33500 / DSM 1411 / JCM 8866 / NBRC 14739 / NCIMB 2177 / R-4) TaxID=523841 RepID=I3RB81_HALMT|nr:ABC transporter ATP-binding protein [Haloferax mediterranei]AFK21491.1 branched-chain amino acid ABC transporter ATP-binding protein [Haloferax mediterranei ATCC 33500]AHZ24451.1 branched-chain amino acid ABC transporter ATP-binding protein [Haloferax mediterranei ATCC 33500]ELZ97197.1 branched-chain amino acid ABC transporter ATP-binding protein [Haloferax mediterranei ATCC 33500]MDX5990065.1 ABC transporter ATP-binding protein [Haloferax mediterranei ATCC 33500]QCQ76849.1 ABC transporter 